MAVDNIARGMAASALKNQGGGGVSKASELENDVPFVSAGDAQTLTDAQKERARVNIGASHIRVESTNIGGDTIIQVVVTDADGKVSRFNPKGSDGGVWVPEYNEDTGVIDWEYHKAGDFYPVPSPVPTGIPVPATAAVGQTIVVSEVDAEGKPTKWKARDAGAGGVDSYVDLNDKPSINGVELTGNKTSADLGIGNPTDEQVSNAVSSWLDEHPEATTSVLDGSIGPEKTTWLDCVYNNEYNPADADAQDGYFFFSDSNAATAGGGTAAFSVSGFIPVTAGKQYCSNYIRKIKWLDSSKAFIATSDGGNSTNKVLVAPENASYVRFDVASANKEKAFFYEYLGEFHDYSAYHTERILSTNDPDYDNMLTESVRNMFANGVIIPEKTFPTESVGFKQIAGFEEFHWNIVSPDFIEHGILTNTGAEDNRVDSGNMVYRRTTFIPVEAGEEYHALGFIILLYDSNKNYIGAPDLVAGKGKFVVPENGAYIRCHGARYDGVEPTFPVIRRGYGRNDLDYGSKVNYSEYVPVFKNEHARKGFAIHLGVNPWVDKKFCFIGDSFSAPGVWQTEMCSRLLASPAGNKAVSGGRWSDTADVPCAYKQAQGFVSDGFTPDVIFCMLGVNDANNSVQLGDIVESTEIADFDTTTYTGGMQACLNYLQNNFPDAAIFVGWTPAGSNCNFASGDVVEPYVERMKEVCLMYGVRYLETRACGITRYSAAYADCFEAGTGGGHPTDAGHIKIGEYMSRLI